MKSADFSSSREKRLKLQGETERSQVSSPPPPLVVVFLVSTWRKFTIYFILENKRWIFILYDFERLILNLNNAIVSTKLAVQLYIVESWPLEHKVSY